MLLNLMPSGLGILLRGVAVLLEVLQCVGLLPHRQETKFLFVIGIGYSAQGLAILLDVPQCIDLLSPF